MKTPALLTLCALFFAVHGFAQEDLLSLLGEEEEVNYTSASFKTNRVINLQSLENTGPGVMDVKISHRFGFLNEGIYELFGLDNALIRIGADIGLTNHLMVGFGRSSFEKTFDGYAKLKLLRQSTGKRNTPFSILAYGSAAVKTIRFADPDRENYFSSRMFYAGQLIIGRKFSESFSMQLSPTIIHRNLVSTTDEENDVLAIGIAARQKLTRRLSINAEYIYVLPDQILDTYENSFSIGFDIETGGHVFQLHFTNSTSMIEKGFVAESTGDWFDGGIHFGFNVSRVFTLWRKDEL
jgi:hypothetical protein